MKKNKESKYREESKPSKSNNNKIYNNSFYKDIKKIDNHYIRVYEPHKNNNGILVEESQIIVPEPQDEEFDRYKILSKMNRLSNILLARANKQNKNENRNYDSKVNNRTNSFDRHYMARNSGIAINRLPFFKEFYN